MRGQPITDELALKPVRKNRKTASIPAHTHFAMLEMQALEQLSALICTAPKAAALLTLLIRQLKGDSCGVVVASRQTIAELLGTSTKTADRALDVLTNGGWVQRIRISGAHALAVNSRVAWVGPRGNIAHAAFSATVVASRSEQDELALNPPPAQTVPVILKGEVPVPFGDGLPPPSQPCIEGLEPAFQIKQAIEPLTDEEFEAGLPCPICAAGMELNAETMRAVEDARAGIGVVSMSFDEFCANLQHDLEEARA